MSYFRPKQVEYVSSQNVGQLVIPSEIFIKADHIFAVCSGKTGSIKNQDDMTRASSRKIYSPLLAIT